MDRMCSTDSLNQSIYFPLCLLPKLFPQGVITFFGIVIV